jgi:arylsulfatase A-like enzyme
LLNDLLESLEKDGLLDDATIIIHGDHGSRITLANPLAAMSDYYTDRDVIDGFSTLFAIRSETIEPGYDGLSRSIQNLFAELVLDKPAAAEANTVFLQKGQVDQRSPMEEVPMPEF